MSSSDGSSVTFRRDSGRTCARGRSRISPGSCSVEVARGRRVRLPDHRRCGTAAAEPGVSRQGLRDRRAVVSSRADMGRPRRPARTGRYRHFGWRGRGRRRASSAIRTEQEIRILMLHGVLHLLGMDHETDGGRMARAEKRWRERLGLPDGLIERVRRMIFAVAIAIADRHPAAGPGDLRAAALPGEPAAAHARPALARSSSRTRWKTSSGSRPKRAPARSR